MHNTEIYNFIKTAVLHPFKDVWFYFFIIVIFSFFVYFVLHRLRNINASNSKNVSRINKDSIVFIDWKDSQMKQEKLVHFSHEREVLFMILSQWE